MACIKFYETLYITQARTYSGYQVRVVRLDCCEALPGGPHGVRAGGIERSGCGLPKYKK